MITELKEFCFIDAVFNMYCVKATSETAAEKRMRDQGYTVTLLTKELEEQLFHIRNTSRDSKNHNYLHDVAEAQRAAEEAIAAQKKAEEAAAKLAAYQNYIIVTAKGELVTVAATSREDAERKLRGC